MVRSFSRSFSLSIKLLLLLFAASHLVAISRAASSRQAVDLSQRESKVKNSEDERSAGSEAEREGVLQRRSAMVYTDEMIANLKLETEKAIDSSPQKVAHRMGLNATQLDLSSWLMVAHRMGLNASQWHWNCSQRGDPWKIKGGKLGLIFVYTRVQTVIRRGILRLAYSQYNLDFDVVFAVGFPENSGYMVERTCQEQEMEGDLILVNCKESHNEGKIYHTIVHLAVLLNSVWKGGYKQIIKLDDDTYAHLPNLATYLNKVKGQELAGSKYAMWGPSLGHYNFGSLNSFSIDLFLDMTTTTSEGGGAGGKQVKGEELAGSKYAMWGPSLGHYYFGSLNGFSVDLFLEVVPKIEIPKYIGGQWEDWMLGFYMRIYGPREILDIAMETSYWTHIESWDHNVTVMIETVRSKPRLCFFHTKVMEDWQLLVDVVKDNKE
eukprot:gene17170-23486_t